MRRLRWVIASMLVGGALIADVPATAQTYDPNWPVCLLVHGSDGSYLECGYSSLAQCAASAAGRGAECQINPYYAHAEPPVGGHRRRGHAY